MQNQNHKIAIVTETLCCMSESDCRAYDVRLIPLSCRVGTQTVRDRILTERLHSEGETYGSIPPSEEAYRGFFRDLLEEYDGVLCITASRCFSESNRHAVMAAADLRGRVTVIDSGAVAGGLFLMVLRARHMVTLGYPMSRIKVELESYKNTLRISFTSHSPKVLENAYKLGFRLPPPEQAATRIPIFRIENGSIRITDFTEDDLSTGNTLLSVLDVDRRGRRSPSHVVVHYEERTPLLEQVLDLIRERYPSVTIYERPASLSIYANLGSGLLGIIGD